MLTFVKETTTVWEKLKKTTKPIVLYGMGNGADKILDWCLENKVKVNEVFASDAFVRGQSYRGFTVLKYSDIANKYEDFLIVLAFASESPIVLPQFYELSTKREFLAPHLPLFEGDEIVTKDWLEKYETRLQEAYDKLSDEKSKEVFADLINYKISGNINYLKNAETQRRDDLVELVSLESSPSSKEVYLDLGAYNGDTIEEFLELTNNNYKQIIALEPDTKNFKKLQKNIETKEIANTILVNKGIWKENTTLFFSNSGGRQSTLVDATKLEVPVTTIDTICDEAKLANPLTFIKMDVEGAEIEALTGGASFIAKDKPKLFIAAYHRDNDLFLLPELISKLANYDIYLRKHPYIPAWEINYICIPKKS